MDEKYDVIVLGTGLKVCCLFSYYVNTGEVAKETCQRLASCRYVISGVTLAMCLHTARRCGRCVCVRLYAVCVLCVVSLFAFACTCGLLGVSCVLISVNYR